jgi:predicted ABC-type ATPase
LEVFVIAGPNGSGKSTAAKRIVPPTATFLNADDIAREEGLTDIAAGRVFLQRIDELAAAHADIAIETTLASRTLANRIVRLKADGYRFKLAFMWLDSADLAINRVRERVLAGGHHVPEETIRRRYTAGLGNLFELYIPLADSWRVYDNRRPRRPMPIASGRAGIVDMVYNGITWDMVLEGRRYG